MKYSLQRTAGRGAGVPAALLILESVIALAAIVFLPQSGAAATAVWTAPDLDSWFYTNAESSGNRLFAPTFAGGLAVVNGAFAPLGASGPARAGAALVGFNTSVADQGQSIPMNLLPGQYHIRSLFRHQINGLGAIVRHAYDFHTTNGAQNQL